MAKKNNNLSEDAVVAVNIRIDQIDENPDNRQIFNMDEIERLAHTIQTDGFSGAIEVFQKDNGRYEISSGHRRFNAMKLLERETIPAIVKPMPDEITKRKKLIKSNINHRNMRPLDWARAIFYARETYYMQDARERGITYPPENGKRYYPKLNVMELLEQDFGMKRNQITKYLSLLKLIPELTQMVEDNKILWGAIIPVASENHATQKKIYNELNILYENGSADDDGQKVPLTKNQVELITKKYVHKVKQTPPAPNKAVEEKIEQIMPVYDDNVVSYQPFFSEKTMEEKFDFDDMSNDGIERPISVLFSDSHMKQNSVSEKSNEAERPEAPVAFIDATLQNISEQLNRLLEMDCRIMDKDSAKQNVKKLRKILDKIETIMS